MRDIEKPVPERGVKELLQDTTGEDVRYQRVISNKDRGMLPWLSRTSYTDEFLDWLAANRYPIDGCRGMASWLNGRKDTHSAIKASVIYGMKIRTMYGGRDNDSRFPALQIDLRAESLPLALVPHSHILRLSDDECELLRDALRKREVLIIGFLREYGAYGARIREEFNRHIHGIQRGLCSKIGSH